MGRRFLLTLYRQAQQFKSFSQVSSQTVTQVETPTRCNLEELQGKPWKLFHSPVNTAIAHCVSNDFQMDRGIAKQFLKKYGHFDELKQKGLIFPDGQNVGKIGVLETKERYIYYLITRNNWWDPATYSAMEQSLYTLRSHCTDHNVDKLAIPRLGAQHDRLEWKKVRELILDAFKDSRVSITAYSQR